VNRAQASSANGARPAHMDEAHIGVTRERADVVIVGGRIAGCATAIPLARAGLRVVVLDRAHFPSNTLSTHGIWPRGVRELDHLGALERILALDPPKIRSGLFHHLGVPFRSGFRAIEGGFDYALCIPRTHLDTALVQAAREQGVEVRERTAVHDLLWDGARVCGVRHGSSGERAGGEIRASLVVGADGRRSTVAELVGAEPYRGSRRGRGFVYWYMDDPKLGTAWREMGPLFRVGETIVLVGPMPGGRMLVLLMCPAEDVARFRRDPEGRWEQALREDRRLADRVAGATRPTRMFSSADIDAFVRPSSGPGWALVGDAGHFKDPGIAQGIPDSLVHGRRLGEMVAAVLREAEGREGGPERRPQGREGAPERLDGVLRECERRRDEETLSTYHWANRETRVDPVQPMLLEAMRTFWRGEGYFEFTDVLNGERAYEQVATPWRGLTWVARALARPGADRRLLLRQAAREVTIDFSVRTERGLARFRPTQARRSERPGWHAPKAASR
jgi:2-polyprenyl-6-methoxyphenol hydroxylase-like FAD-dependent oxidoreductase